MSNTYREVRRSLKQQVLRKRYCLMPKDQQLKVRVLAGKKGIR